ncbi:MAG: hypothetical protein ABII21_00205 [bacterium]
MVKTQLTFDEYAKIEVRVGTIVSAIIPEGSEKLIQFIVDFGDEKRTIYSGIKEWCNPEELVEVKTVWVTNIPSKKTPFGESQGMLFACDTVDGKPYVVRIGDEVPNGSEFH